MLRTAVGLAWMVLAACTSSTPAPRVSTSAWRSGPLVAAAEVESGRTDDGEFEIVDRHEADLVAAVQCDSDPVVAALELVARFEAQERLEDALRILERASEKQPRTALDVASASVLRDLGRRQEALERLRYCQERDPSTIGPGLCLEMAELAWICGDFDRASDALRSMRATVEGASLEKLRAAEVAVLEQAIRDRSAPRAVKVRDLLGDLRGSADSDHRLRTLRVLLGQRSEVAQRACVIAVDDPDPRLRALGVERAVVGALDLAEFCAVALSDEDPVVRAAGAARAEALPADERIPLLLPALAVETSAVAFSEIDVRLCAAAGILKPADAVQAGDASFRKRIVEDRRSRIEQ